MTGACDDCLARAWLLARLAGHFDLHRDRTHELLALGDDQLIAALGGKASAEIERDLSRFEPAVARRRAETTGLALLCRCQDDYPPALRELESPPAVLHIAGDPELVAAGAAVAIVGSRRPSSYGTEVAHTLARAAGVAGVTVISGMAAGIDAGAHRGALSAGGATVAVLAGAAELAYPARARALHRQIVDAGAVVSELPPATATRRWMFPARNRLIAALASITVVVEARPGSGALLTARAARELGRPVAAVPGRITSPLARGPHELLRTGALLVQQPEDLLDGLYDPDTTARRADPRPALDPQLRRLLDALAEGHTTAAALSRAGLAVDAGLAALAALELAGLVRREAGGAYAVRP